MSRSKQQNKPQRIRDMVIGRDPIGRIALNVLTCKWSNKIMNISHRIFHSQTDTKAAEISAYSNKSVESSTQSILFKGIMVVFLYQLVAGLTPAILISLYYEPSLDFVRIYDTRELTMFLIWGFFIPITFCSFWVWQPIAIEETFESLRRNQVITKLDDKAWIQGFLGENLHQPLSSPWTLGTIIILSISWYLIGGHWVSNAAQHGHIWWNVYPPYFECWLIASMLIPAYLLFWIIARQLFLVRMLYKLFSEANLSPKLMNSDGCMGFSAIGKYAFIFSVPIVLYGIAWTLGIIVMPFTNGTDPTYGITMVCLELYVVGIPLFLIAPSLPAHHSLKKEKERRLGEIGREIEHWFHKKMQEGQKDKKYLESLEYQYFFLKKNYRTWPFRQLNMGQFAVFASLPPAFQFIQTIADFWQ